MAENKNDGADEPEVIVVPPEEQDVMPPERGRTDYIDAEATPVEDAGDNSDTPANKGTRLATWIALLVVAAFVGGFVAWPKLAPTLDPWLPESLKPGNSRLVEVTKALDELALRIATLKGEAVDRVALDDLEARTQTVLNSMQARISDLSARPQLPDDFMEQVLALNGRIDEIAARLEAIAIPALAEGTANNDIGAASEALAQLQTLASTVADLVDRTTQLEERPQADTSDTGVAAAAEHSHAPLEHNHDHNHDALSGQVADLTSLTQTLAARLAEMEARLVAVADSHKGGSGAALVAAVGQLRSRVESGQSFDLDLGTLQALASQGKASADTEKLLTGFQAGQVGIATLPILRREFTALVRPMILVARPPASGWLEAIWQRLSSIISVRRTGDSAKEVTGDDVAARAAQAERHLSADNLQAAVAEMAALPDAAAAVLAPWMGRAQQRLQTLEALDQLTRQAVQQLATPSPGSGPASGATE